MTTPPVTQARIDIAKAYGLQNVDIIAVACREAGVPFYVACALFEKESFGRNVYGHDAGGALSGFDRPVNKSNYQVFKWLVFTQGQTSNGVGPAQLTWSGFFTDMESKGLKPWDVHDNMLYGLQLLASYKAVSGATWEDAGTHYNGARAYGIDFAAKVAAWKQRLHA